MNPIGWEFDHVHGGGTARYRVVRAHRDAGYYECVIVKAIGSHQFLGGIEIWWRGDITAAVARPSCSCGSLTGRHDADCMLLDDGVREEWEAEDESLRIAAEGEETTSKGRW